MGSFSVRNLSAFAFVLSVFTPLSAAQQASGPPQGTTLRAINIVDYEASMGLQRRDSNDLSVLDPQRQSQLVYGSPGDNGKFVLANMTLYAPDSLPIVLLERFEELNVSVKCEDDEGALSLTFGTRDSFDYALKQWGYVNKADDGKFLFITNKDGCGPDGQRQAYTVSNITDDTATLTTSLAAKVVALSDVAGSYDLDLGHATPVSQAHRLKRGVLSDIDHDGEEISNSTSGNLDKDINSFSVNVSAGQQGQRFSVYNDPNAGFALDCINCFIAGSFMVQGHISVQDFTIQDLTLTASPSSVFAALELEAIITATEEPQSITYSKTLFSDPIPGPGYGIPDIVEIGAYLTYIVSGSCTFSGFASIEMGANASLPDSAQIVADYKNHGASSTSGLDSTLVTPLFQINNESASMNLNAISQPAITFGVNLMKAGSAGITVSVNLPEISATMSVGNVEDGACSNVTGVSETGIEVVREASIEVSLEFGATLKADGEDLDDGLAWPLYNISMPLSPTCYPLKIPGLRSSPIATNVPSSSAVLAMSTTLSRVSAFPTPNSGLGGSVSLNSSSLPALLIDIATRLGPQVKSTSTEGTLGSGTLLGPGLTSTMPSSTEPASALFSTGSALISSASGSRLSSRVASSSKTTLPTSTVLASDTQSVTHTSDGKAATSTLSSQQMTSTKTPATSRSSPPTGLSSNSPSTASMDLGGKPTSTPATSSKLSSMASSSISSSSTLSDVGTGPISPPATSSTLSSLESTSVLSSPTSTRNGMTSLSVPNISSTASRTESSPTLLTTSSSSPKAASITNAAKSRSSSTTSTHTDLESTSAHSRSFTTSKVEASSTLSSLTQRTSGTTSSSAITISSTSSRTRPRSTLLSTVSSSLKTASTTTFTSSNAEVLSATSLPASKKSRTASSSASTTDVKSTTTPASSKVQPSASLSSFTTTKSRITSSPTTSSTVSRSESSSSHSSPASLSPETTSAATPQISSTSELASTLHSSTRSSNTHSLSASESSHSTKVDTNTKGPSPSSSKSASKELSHTPSSTSTPSSRSSLSISSSQTAEHTTKVTTTTATPSTTLVSHPVDTKTSAPSPISTTVKTQSPKPPTSSTSSHSTTPILPATSIHSAAKEAEASPTPGKISYTKSPVVPSPKPEVNPPTPSPKGESPPSTANHGGSKGSGESSNKPPPCHPRPHHNC